MTDALVLDASAAIRFVLKSPDWEKVEAELRGVPRVLVPNLFFSEISNALWKHVRVGDLTLDAATGCFESLCALVDLPEHSDDVIGAEALRASVEHDHPAYDFFYATLASNHDCGVLTWDRRLRALLAKMEITALPHDPSVSTA